MKYYFQLGKRLIKLNLDYVRILRDIHYATVPLLKKYMINYSEFNDHSYTHTERVIANSDNLVAQNLRRLNVDEIFIYLIACYFHDTGMGINDEFYDKYAEEVLADLDTKNMSKKEIIRKYHNEFSAKILEMLQPKINNLPKEISDAARILCKGHRNYDLFDTNKFPKEIMLSNGSVVHIAYLTGLLRFADHMDLTRTRTKNIYYVDDDKFLEGYVNASNKINSVKYLDDKIVVNISEYPKMDYGFNHFIDEIYDEFIDFKNIVKTRTDFIVFHENIIFNVV
ncbi:MAG: hypothetical protein Q4E88_03870 [Coriobacteriia bacterium]|nr:hypothetical protein [Coriobacteriia bacterium]